MAHLIDSPADWKSDQLSPRSDWIRQLDEAEIAEIDAALREACAEEIPMAELPKEDFPLVRFPALVERVHQSLENGPGIFMIRGFPVDRFHADYEFPAGRHPVLQQPCGDARAHGVRGL
ncbi:MAG TPA: hypothetical protein VF157_06990, partial [Chloroflexota bacterium]